MNFKLITNGCCSNLLRLIGATWQSNYKIIQKWTIVVDTPNGEVHGNSNLKLVMSPYKKPNQEYADSSTGLYGEAPYVKLSDKYLFALGLYEPMNRKLFIDNTWS